MLVEWARRDVQFVLLIRRKEKAMNENIIEYIVRETSYPSAIKQEVIGVIVRCKDCRYGYHFYDVQNGITDSWVECRNPNGLNRDVQEDGYCYCGERKSDGRQN